MGTEVNLREWASQFDQLRNKVRAVRMRGMVPSTEEHRGYQSALATVKEGFENIKANNTSHAVAASEIARREVLLGNLNKEIKEIMASSSVKVMDSNASNLGQRTDGGSGSVITNPIRLSDRGLVQRQEAAIREQDDMINEIGSGVGRLHKQALEMGRESNLQSKLVDSLETDVENAADDLREEARHANEVREKTKMFGLYVCAFIELVLVIILIVVVISNGGFRTSDR